MQTLNGNVTLQNLLEVFISKRKKGILQKSL